MKTKKLKASVLVMSLLIMFAIVIITLSATLVSVRDRKISIGSGKSSRAFQTAQGGIEKALKVIIDRNSVDSVGLIVTDLGAVCNAGIIELPNYTVELKDSGGNNIDCGGFATVAEITSVKVVGREGGTENRAIEAAVAQTVTAGVVGGCMAQSVDNGANWNVILSTNWGDGCDTGATSTNAFEVCDDIENSSIDDYHCGMSSITEDYMGNQYVACICVNE